MLWLKGLTTKIHRRILGVAREDEVSVDRHLPAPQDWTQIVGDEYQQSTDLEKSDARIKPVQKNRFR